MRLVSTDVSVCEVGAPVSWKLCESQCLPLCLNLVLFPAGGFALFFNPFEEQVFWNVFFFFLKIPGLCSRTPLPFGCQ